MVNRDFAGPIVTDKQARVFIINALSHIDMTGMTEQQKEEILDDQLHLHSLNRDRTQEQCELDDQLRDYRLSGVAADEVAAKVEDNSDAGSEKSEFVNAHTVRHLVTGSVVTS